MPELRKSLVWLLTSWLVVACAGPRDVSTPAPPTTVIIVTPTAAPGLTPSKSDLLDPEASPVERPQDISTAQPAPSPTSVLLPGPDCAVGLQPTRPDMEGPYFLAGSPEKTSLIEPGMSGTPLTISGYVMTVDCKWVPGAKLDFWQADASGEYDLQGYRLRGHVFSDDNGYYQIETILPAPYQSRPRHIHVKVQVPGRPELTTQLYFPGDAPYPDLTVDLLQDAQGATADFNFILGLE